MTPADNTISLDQSSPAFGDSITFSYSIDPKVKHPAIYVRVYQGTNDDGTPKLVFAAGGWPLVTDFTLGPSTLWTGGEAQAVATLEDEAWGSRTRNKTLAHQEFNVAA